MRSSLLVVLVLLACGDSDTTLDSAVADSGADADSGGDSDTGVDAGPDICAETLIESVRVPMRDGADLAALVKRPVDETCRMPTVLIQTPYNIENVRSLWLDTPSPGPLFASPAYAIVAVDWRGVFGSTDAGPVMRGQRGEDGYDTVEWIAAQPWSSGSVGTFGPSALCRSQWFTAVEQPPALRAIVPIFCGMNDTYDQYYPGGVLRHEYVETLGVLFGGGGALFDNPVENPFWNIVGNTYPAGRVAVPALVVAGFWDLHPPQSFQDFAAVRAVGDPAARDAHKMIIGPWFHFATNAESTGIGRDWVEEELAYFDDERWIEESALAFFDHHLRGIDNGVPGWSPVQVAPSGADAHESYDTWPPAEGTERSFYLAPGDVLSEAAPTGTDERDFPYDPLDPSPTVGGQTLRFDLLHGPTDQAPVLARADAVAFTSAPLAEPLEIRGRIAVELDGRTTGTDTDFAVRLTDVSPDGTHLLIGEGSRRLMLRDTYAATSGVDPGERYSVRVELTTALAYDLPVGHQLGVIVTGSNYPRFARNPNTITHHFMEETAPVAVTNTVILDGSSRLIVMTR